jgi:internalin A
MLATSGDQQIIARLFGHIDDIERRSQYDDEGHLTRLGLSHLHLSQLPPEIGRLIYLQSLELNGNQLQHLPTELGQLTSLQELGLSENQLTHLPAELGQLTSLQELSLFGNQLIQIPGELGQLTSLQKLFLNENQLTVLPADIGQLTSLQVLSLSHNQLTLLPPSIVHLKHLQALFLHHNQLTELPADIGQLNNLQELYLSGNRLRQLPADIGQLNNLQKLFLNGNRLRQLPIELGQLTELIDLDVSDNPDLLTPPPEIVSQGREAILRFFQELQKDSVVRYEAKVLVVGEGATGKSSLLRALRDQAFDPQLNTTHGIEVGELHVPHPHLAGKAITLNTWDFGGQHIYHATHQFFLTRRSLYLLVWNARSQVDQGRLDFWLETIRVQAPEAPVLLVATHTDERASDLNYERFKGAFPQLVGHFSVSNKDRRGIDDLATAIAWHAAELHLMGQPWPGSWVQAEHRLLTLPDHHIDAGAYTGYCDECGIEPEIANGTLGSYLHDLGKILYFRDDQVLSNFVVLKPNWVTKAISRVLTDEVAKNVQGILSHADLPRIWASDDEGQSYEPYLYPIFLRLMERFDLSYQIDPERPGTPSSRSLVPQLLPYQPPTNLPSWPRLSVPDHVYVEMRYRFDFVPTGIIPWFIVRTHRYTQNLHWREGVVLGYQDHQARVELNPNSRELRLVAWGVQPLNFFNILMSTLDLLLDRFEGLRIQREVPCICSWQDGAGSPAEPCPRFYRYEDLERRMKAGRYEVECPESFRIVSVLEMLYGIHISTHEQIIADIRRDQQRLLQEQQQVQQALALLPEMFTTVKGLDQLTELIWRQMLRQWNYEMQRLEAECPNLFFLSLSTTGRWKRLRPKNWVSQEYLLHLICQHPPGPHPVGEGYSLREAKDWWLTMSPWFNHLMTVLKYALPVGKALGGIYDATGLEQIQRQIALLEEINTRIPELSKLDSLNAAVPDPYLHRDQQVTGAALRALYQFLIKADASCTWGGLNKVATPDGNIFWLCEKHRQEFEAKPLDQRYVR